MVVPRPPLFGQALASRPDLAGAQLADALTVLQDRVEPIPDEIARALVAAEAPSLLPSLSTSPVAAASLCSVYKAEVDGKPVAVKVNSLSISLLSLLSRANRERARGGQTCNQSVRG